MVAEYFVEGVTADSPPRSEAVPLHASWNRGSMWADKVRAIGLEEGTCPTGPGQVNYHPYCNGDWSACFPPSPCPCEPQPPGGGLSLPESSLPASPGFPEPVLVAEAGSSTPAGPVTARRVLGELVMHEETLVDNWGRGAPSAPDRLVGQLITPSTTQWLHTDHLGSTRVVTDATGTVVSLHKYLPFGEEYESFNAPGTNSHKFTGHERDAETGLDYMMARYYGNALGRFLSVDPADDTDLTLTHTWNRYVYVRNNPLRLTDESGQTVADMVRSGINIGRGFVQSITGGAYPGAGPQPSDTPLDLAEQAAGSAIGGLLGGAAVVGGPSLGLATAPSGVGPVAGTAVAVAGTVAVAGAVANLAAITTNLMGGESGNTNPYAGPVDQPVTVVDPDGNATPVDRGQQVGASPDGKWQQVKDAQGRPTGTRLDGGGHTGHSDPRAQQPHAHRPGVTDEDGSPWLPVQEKK